MLTITKKQKTNKNKKTGQCRRIVNAVVCQSLP